MKKTIILKTILSLLFVFPILLQGQTIKEFETGPFTGVSAGGVFTVHLHQADKHSVIVEADEEQIDNITAEVKNNILSLNYDRRILRRVDRVVVNITSPVFENIIASGIASIKSENTLTPPSMKLTASGASNVQLEIETNNIISGISGTANVTLTGKAALHETETSGAATLKAYNLQTSKTIAKGSGVSSLQVNASETLNANTSGTSSINYQQVPESYNFNVSGAGKIDFKGDPGDRDINSPNLRTGQEHDTVRVKIGQTDFIVISDEKKMRVTRNKRRSFRNNWSGIELGINGYLTPGNSLDLNDDYLDIDYSRAVSLNLNLFQQNFNIIGNNLGFFTGLGFTFNNYSFENNIRLEHTKDSLGYENTPHGFKRNRLSQVHFKIPVMLEIQSSGRRKIEQFHISAGVTGSARLRTYTKQVYDFDGDTQKEKFIKGYHTTPFNLDATARIGWGRVNLFANYSLFPLFREDKGPELYPFNVGIRLIGW